MRGGEAGLALTTREPRNRIRSVSDPAGRPGADRHPPTPSSLVLFGRGAFDPTSALFSSQCLAAYAVGLPAFVAGEGADAGLLCPRDTAMPVKVGTLPASR